MEFYKYCKKNKYSRGFTVIELLIVIIIIALFVVLGAPAFNKYNHVQEVNTKASELKGLTEGANLKSQFAQQGYDSVLVTIGSENAISYFGNTDNCDISSKPDVGSQIEGVSLLGFNITSSSFSSLLICFANSGLKKSFSYSGNGSGGISPITNGFDINIKVSSGGYENYDFATTPHLHVKGIANDGEEAYSNLILEIINE